MAENAAAAGASGISAESGSPVAANIANIYSGEQDASMIKYNAAQRAWGNDAQAAQYKGAAEINRAEARQAQNAGLFGLAGTLLGGVGDFVAGGGFAKNQMKTAKKTPISYGWTDQYFRGR